VQTSYLHEDLPFSEEEFYRAFRLVQSEKKARSSAAFVVQMVNEVNERAERARLARERGSQNPQELQVPVWIVGDGAFALLALVSDDLRTRVDAYMRGQLESQREPALRDRLYRPGGTILREPTPEVHAEVDALLAGYAAEWTRLCERTRADVERRQKRQRGG
jgi:hypothetical protein